MEEASWERAGSGSERQQTEEDEKEPFKLTITSCTDVGDECGGSRGLGIGTGETEAVRKRTASIYSKRVGKYVLGRTLGEGEYGKVKAAKNTETGEKVAVKILHKRELIKKNMIENVKKEIAILKRIKHKHVIELKDVLVSQTKIYLVMELSTGGELYYILATKGKFNEKTARRYFQQLISGVDYFHKQGICHRDLKPENLLLSEEGTLKISDFGLSTLYKDDNKGSRLLFTACGTPNYAAPEVLEGKGYDGKIADIWSCGCILFTFLAGYLPFNESSTEELYRKIRTADFKIPSWVSLGARDILRRILCPNPARRITIQELRQHEWFLIDNECTFEEEPSVDLSAVNPDEEITQINELKNSTDGDSEFSSDVETTSPRELLGTLHKYYGLLKDITEGFTSQLRRSTGSVTTRLRETHQTQFVSQHPPTVILERLIAVLKGYPEVGYKVDQESFKVRVTGRADKEAGILSFRIQIFELEPNGMYLVDFVKGRGDALAFHKFYQHIWEQVKDLCSGADAVEAARKRSNPKPLSSSEMESLNRRFPSSTASSLSSSPSSHASSPLLSREDHVNTYAYGEEDVEQKEEEEGWGGSGMTNARFHHRRVW